MMKALHRCAVVISSLVLASCAATDSTPFQKEVEALGETSNRKQLYAAFPPLAKPTPNPVLVTSNGTSGYESYPISNKLTISYTVLYAATASKQEHIFTDKQATKIFASPLDQTSKFEIRERN